MPLSTIILAAGQGKRMNSDLPKVLQPLAGRPLLGHVLEAAQKLGADGRYIVYGHGGELVREACKDKSLHWVHQAEQLGTGHAAAQAIGKIPDDHTVLVLCADVPLTTVYTLQQLIEVGEAGLAVLTVVMDDATGYGRILRDAQGQVTAIVEERDATPEQRVVREVNTGLIASKAQHLKRWLGQLDNNNAQGEYYLTDIVGLAVAENIQVEAVEAVSPEEVLGINDKLQLAEAESIYRRRIAEDLMRGGVTLADPQRIDIRGSLRCGRDVVIDINAVFEGDVVLGDRVTIGPNCVIRDSELGEDTEVRACSIIEQSETGARCQIGPYARLRPESSLADEVRIGNFVEIKKSNLAFGSKVNHLTYVGDSEVGQRVNVGAGTITCNYDGAYKHKTVLGDDAFIGSGVQLVAPVRVGAGATIGAGTVVTKDAPEGKLTVGRARQETIEGWHRPAKKLEK
ncbi:MAG: bifunctional UDP-N-acetylglucosamine diphosphorylase/glucosamine-1-phosphate N-acetyltransferase GlmU [Gammaproteobacteria bacterium]|nr:bifunctional UDP-N-acetylglucosamine diphosphorylase/glucosamine-1-phosphate N-acetyltransferase GlmU [Gammaproteobacteria bacterium]